LIEEEEDRIDIVEEKDFIDVKEQGTVPGKNQSRIRALSCCAISVEFSKQAEKQLKIYPNTKSPPASD